MAHAEKEPMTPLFPNSFSSVFPLYEVTDLPPYEFLPEGVKISKRYMEKSGLYGLLEDYSVSLDGKVLDPGLGNESEDRPEQLLFEEGFYTVLFWDKRRLGKDKYFAKSVVAEAARNGSLIIHGNVINGSTVLRREEWEEDFGVLEKAMEKAVKNPTTLTLLTQGAT